MGYEIAGGLGVKMADPTREIFVMVGDGSYLMLNSELATSVLLGRKIILVITNNHGYGCINRLQNACGGEPFNNLFRDCKKDGDGIPPLNFEMHAKSLGALSETVTNIKELEEALGAPKKLIKVTLSLLKQTPIKRLQKEVIGGRSPLPKFLKEKKSMNLISVT